MSKLQSVVAVHFSHGADPDQRHVAIVIERITPREHGAVFVRQRVAAGVDAENLLLGRPREAATRYLITTGLTGAPVPLTTFKGAAT